MSRNKSFIQFFLVLLIFFFNFVLPLSVLAATSDKPQTQEMFVRGDVLEVLSQREQVFDKEKSDSENLKIKILGGAENGKIVSVLYSADERLKVDQRIRRGDSVVIDSKPDNTTKKMTYSVYEPYRLNNFWLILVGFSILIIAVAGSKGVGALLGLTISILTISVYIIPSIIKGSDPLSVCLTASVFILLLTTYVAHGISIKTTMAVLGTGISLFIAVYIAGFAVQFLHLFGLGNEDVQSIVIGTTHLINPQGLLLGSIIIGTLGALNDITTTQSVAIFTLARENPEQHFLDLFKKGMLIGREHIASLVNTLVLAYAGTSLAIFIFFALNPAHLPWWVILNNEATMEEIIRTMVGSSALIIAVPITSLLAAYISLNIRQIGEITRSVLR